MKKKATSALESDNTQGKGQVIFKPRGLWTAETAEDIEGMCSQKLKETWPKQVIFDLTDFTQFDTTGIWVLQRMIEALEQGGHSVSTEGGSPSYLKLKDYLKTFKLTYENLPAQPSFFEKRLEALGKASLDILILTRNLILFLGQVTVGFARVLRHPKKLRFISLVAHMESFGVNAIPIVCLMSVSLGLVLAYQGEEQLRRFGAEIYTINLVSISILREVGILITAILVAGRTGSAITAQIGIMKINQEVDALDTLGLSPMEILVLPRILALILVMPLLAFISDLAGLLGGGIMVVFSLDVSPQLYIYRIGEAVTMGGFWVGILKAPLFGAIIGVVSCFEGLRVSGTAESVGEHTTRSVVEGIFIVTIADALLSVFFSQVGI